MTKRDRRTLGEAEKVQTCLEVFTLDKFPKETLRRLFKIQRLKPSPSNECQLFSLKLDRTWVFQENPHIVSLVVIHHSCDQFKIPV